MNNKLICFRLFDAPDKSYALQESIHSLAKGTQIKDTFIVDPNEFRLLPGAPFAYWVGSRVRDLFASLSQFANPERSVKQGLATSDDFRFARLAWEIEPIKKGDQWYPMCKGGSSSPFYADLFLVVNWSRNGAELKAEVDRKYSHIVGYQIFWVVKNPDVYFLPGLTYPLRTAKFTPQAMPTGAIISVRGSGIYCANPLQFLALMSSTAFDRLVKLLLGRDEHPQFDMGDIAATPVPDLTGNAGKQLESLAREVWGLKRSLDTAQTTSHAFERPTLFALRNTSLKGLTDVWRSCVLDVEQRTLAIQAEIDALALQLYGLNEADLGLNNVDLSIEPTELIMDSDISLESPDVTSITISIVEYLAGCIYGRWDIYYATGEKATPELPDPFDPLPICPPGMLQNAAGLPAELADVPNNYPLGISWSGILVDDKGELDDIEARVQDALTVIWSDNHEAIEQEACEILGVKTLRDYFHKPAGFFADHLKRYSKSRRQAPIYWPLSTEKGTYTLWLYYHRLTDQTLFTCMNDFVQPKLNDTEAAADALRSKSSRSRDEEKELERLQDLEAELRTFKDELLRLAPLWKPNLNDGVQITAAPLWKLFKLPKWQKTLKETWDKLEKGDYDWAHLAYSLWPERVEAKCKTDKSLAIAHDREDPYEAPPATEKKSRGRKAKAAEITMEMDEENGEE